MGRTVIERSPEKIGNDVGWDWDHIFQALQNGQDQKRIRFFSNLLRREAHHGSAACEQFKREITSGRTIEDSSDFVMRSYMCRGGKKDKDGVRSEAHKFRNIYTEMYLGKKPK